MIRGRSSYGFAVVLEVEGEEEDNCCDGIVSEGWAGMIELGGLRKKNGLVGRGEESSFTWSLVVVVGLS